MIVRGLSAFGLLLCLAAQSHLAFAKQADLGFGSPVRLFAIWTELSRYDDNELSYVLPRVAHLAGSDNHGYEFPGAIDRVLELDPTASVSCQWETMSMYPRGDRWTELNPNEEVFIHSADPASLRVVPSSLGGAVITFRIDGRALRYAPYGQPVGVDRYLVEWASSPEGPFTPLAEVTEQVRTWIHFVEDPDHQPNRYYRVRTVFTDQTVNPYSWVASSDPSEDAHFYYGILLHDGSMYAACSGAGCPADPSEVVIEADRNHNRTIDGACEPAGQGQFLDEPPGCERRRFTAASPIADGFMYSGMFAGYDAIYDYRMVLDSKPSVAVPSGTERYQVYGNNNRIQMWMFGTYLLWPDNPQFQAQSQLRLAECLDQGYTGMRLDYTLADLAPSWIASGLPPDWHTGAQQRLLDGVVSQLTGLRNYERTANITINGYHAATDQSAYYTFIGSISGGDTEWFAFGNHPGSTMPHSNVLYDLQSMIYSASIGKWAIAQVGGLGPNGAENHDARRNSLALYLLVADEHNYYHFTTDNYYREVEYYPEWDLPLGNPLIPLLEMTYSDFRPFGNADLLSRVFENGWTLFNAGTDPITVQFDTPVYEVVLAGGRIPELGGDGTLVYEQREELVLDGWSGALVLKSAP